MLIFINLLAVLFITTFVFPDEYHYKNIPIGGRGGFMGGAYVAVSDDPTGCFYNPAGIVYASGRSLSVSGNVYNVSEKRYVDTLRGIDGHKYDWVLTSSKLSPSFFGLIDEVGPFKVCFSYAVPDYTFRDQHQIFYNIRSIFPDNPIANYVIDIYDADNTYLIGPSIAYAFSDKLSVGLTMYLHYRSMDIIRNHLIRFAKGESVQANYRESLEEIGIKPIVGLMFTPISRLSVGFKISKTYILYSYKYMQMMESIIGLPGGLSYLYSEDKESTKTPFEYTLGFALFPSSSLLFSFDIDYFPKPSEDRIDVYNFSFGSEIYLRDNIALRFGVYTNYANTPPLSPKMVNQQHEKLDIYGLSMSFSYFTFSSEITTGIGYQFGTGQAQVIPNDLTIQTIKYSNFVLYLSTVYHY